MMTDLILAIAHHLVAFSMLGILFAQYAIVRPGLAGAGLNRVRTFDRFYGLFAGLLSIPPTLRIIAWGRRASADPDFVVPDAEIWRVHTWLGLELVVFVLIPVFAAMMARGIGL